QLLRSSRDTTQSTHAPRGDAPNTQKYRMLCREAPSDGSGFSAENGTTARVPASLKVPPAAAAAGANCTTRTQPIPTPLAYFAQTLDLSAAAPLRTRLCMPSACTNSARRRLAIPADGHAPRTRDIDWRTPRFDMNAMPPRDRIPGSMLVFQQRVSPRMPDFHNTCVPIEIPADFSARRRHSTQSPSPSTRAKRVTGPPETPRPSRID